MWSEVHTCSFNTSLFLTSVILLCVSQMYVWFSMMHIQMCKCLHIIKALNAIVLANA